MPKKPPQTEVLDTEQLGYHFEMIICPNCGDHQVAKVVANPVPVYEHNCTRCDWIITEDEWNPVQPI